MNTVLALSLALAAAQAGFGAAIPGTLDSRAGGQAIVPIDSTASATLPRGWSPASTACIAEGATGRALTGAVITGADMTPSKCATFCASQNFPLAGVEFGSECYCGATLQNGASMLSPSTSCNMACSGSSNMTCGGPNALSLYTNPAVVPVVKGPTFTGRLPVRWTSAPTQCIAEVAGRAFTGYSFSSHDLTVPSCLTACRDRGFKYAGLEYSSECYCGNDAENGASLSATSSDCTMPCSGDATSTCGGSNALQVYLDLSWSPAKSVAGYRGLGCIQEVAGRALTGLRIDDANMTQERCVKICAQNKFTYAGIEYGTECYCGDALDNGATLSATSNECYMDCPGNKSDKCGGPNAIQLFSKF